MEPEGEPMGQTLENLRKVSFLAGLTQEEAQELSAVCEVRRYGDEDSVFTQGEQIPGIFVVLVGAVKVFRTDGRISFVQVASCGRCRPSTMAPSPLEQRPAGRPNA